MCPCYAEYQIMLVFRSIYLLAHFRKPVCVISPQCRPSCHHGRVVEIVGTISVLWKWLRDGHINKALETGWLRRCLFHVAKWKNGHTWPCVDIPAFVLLETWVSAPSVTSDKYNVKVTGLGAFLRNAFEIRKDIWATQSRDLSLQLTRYPTKPQKLNTQEVQWPSVLPPRSTGDTLLGALGGCLVEGEGVSPKCVRVRCRVFPHSCHLLGFIGEGGMPLLGVGYPLALTNEDIRGFLPPPYRPIASMANLTRQWCLSGASVWFAGKKTRVFLGDSILQVAGIGQGAECTILSRCPVEP